MSRSERLLERHAEAIAAAMSRPLLVAMTDGTVPPSVFARYLALEEGFVVTAGHLVALLLESGPDAESRPHLERALQDLRGEQREYFDAATGRGGPREPSRDAPRDALSGYALALVARHGGAAVPVCFAAAETLYAAWCTRAVMMPVARPDAVQRWIDLHATASFAEGAAMWRSMVDRLPPRLIDDALLDAWFSGMLAAENVFHDAAYEGGTE